MTTTQMIIIGVAVIALALIALLASRSGGPRVTEIDRTFRRRKDEK